MKFQLAVAIPLALTTTLTSAMPVSHAQSPRAQIIPTLPALGIEAIRDAIYAQVVLITGSDAPDAGTRSNRYGDALNKYTDFGQHVKDAIGADNVNAIDILADDLCIAGPGQGSLCNELLAYAYAWYVAQQNGWSYQFVAESLGENNMKQITTALNTLCLQPADNEQASEDGVCQRIAFQSDQLANSIIQENTSSEDDNNNQNSLEYFGLQAILPAPTSLGV